MIETGFADENFGEISLFACLLVDILKLKSTQLFILEE